MDAEIVSCSQKPADSHRNGANAELDRCPVLDEPGDVGGDGELDYFDNVNAICVDVGRSPVVSRARDKDVAVAVVTANGMTRG